jgi:hypothetical protein
MNAQTQHVKPELRAEMHRLANALDRAEFVERAPGLEPPRVYVHDDGSVSRVASPYAPIHPLKSAYSEARRRGTGACTTYCLTTTDNPPFPEIPASQLAVALADARREYDRAVRAENFRVRNYAGHRRLIDCEVRREHALYVLRQIESQIGKRRRMIAENEQAAGIVRRNVFNQRQRINAENEQAAGIVRRFPRRKPKMRSL